MSKQSVKGSQEPLGIKVTSYLSYNLIFILRFHGSDPVFRIVEPIIEKSAVLG
jgi:hypothetical protein